jgi:hypothetical protein
VGKFSTTAALFEAASAMTQMQAVEGVVATESGEFKVLYPGDAGYEDARARVVADAG